MAGPNLEGARVKVESLMDDDVLVLNDPGGRFDDVLDELTGELLDPDVPGKLYAGRAMVLPATDGSAPDGESAVASAPSESRSRYRCLLPLAAPALPVGAILSVTRSRRDRQLVGRRFRVSAPGPVSTYAVVRTVELEAV